MKDQLNKRLEQLKAELEGYQKINTDRFGRQANQDPETLLRISGAIQVLEEELAKAEQPSPSGGKPTEDD